MSTRGSNNAYMSEQRSSDVDRTQAEQITTSRLRVASRTNILVTLDRAMGARNHRLLNQEQNRARGSSGSRWLKNDFRACSAHAKDVENMQKVENT